MRLLGNGAVLWRVVALVLAVATLERSSPDAWVRPSQPGARPQRVGDGTGDAWHDRESGWRR